MLLDLGAMPPANWLLEKRDSEVERFPLELEHCPACGNLQLRHCLGAQKLYAHYYYVTPASASLDRHYQWLKGVLFERGYATAASDVLEIGSNRGAFLKVLSGEVRSTVGVDPAANVVVLRRGVCRGASSRARARDADRRAALYGAQRVAARHAGRRGCRLIAGRRSRHRE
jgi:hypothetical protein